MSPRCAEDLAPFHYSPRGQVTAEPVHSTTKDAEFFQKFDVVVATTCSQVCTTFTYQ